MCDADKKLDMLLENVERLEHGIALLDARTKDFNVRLTAVENGPIRPPLKSTTSETLDKLRDSIRPLATETAKQTPLIESVVTKSNALARDQKISGLLSAIAALAALGSALLQHCK